LTPNAHALTIPNVPVLTGVPTVSVVVRMNGIPNIPDHAISFTEMGEIMDAYDGTTTASTQSSAVPKARKEQLRWSEMERRAERDYQQVKDEYDVLIHELTSSPPR
jgi:hypothetical protein